MASSGGQSSCLPRSNPTPEAATLPVVTSMSSASGEQRASLIALSDRSGYAYDHDLPLNGQWSDLTAQFEFIKRPNGFAVILHDIHVL